jgi:chitinase
MKEMGIASKLGATPMIGQNDNRFEIFSLADAKAFRAYLDKRPDVVRVAIWSVERDNGGCPGKPEASDSCSGVEQEPWAYSTLFGQTSPVR